MNMESHLSIRKCPTCGLDGTKEISSKIAAEDISSDELQKYWSGFFKERIFFTYHRCPGCGLLFDGKYLTSSYLNGMYASMSDNTAGQPLQLMQKTQGGYFKILTKHGEIQGNYVEIGPDIGLFTALAAATGKVNRFSLWEPNKVVHDQLRKSTKNITCTIYDDLSSINSLPENSVDVVVMIHVLDHLLEPVSFLKILRSKMKKNGKLCIVTHNEKSLLSRILGRKWPAFCLQHPQLFNPNSIRSMLKSAGFSTEGVYKTINYFPILYLFKHAMWACGVKIPLPNWKSPILPLKLGNIETIGQVLEDHS